MTYELITALLAFAFVASITPGPNNLMLMASGANFGIRRTLPHMLGVGIGFIVMIILVGVGLVQVFNAFPISYTILKGVSVGYLIYLAWKIATAQGFGQSAASGNPFTFFQAALFQWVNPNAWAMALTATSIYAPDQSISAILMVAAAFGIVNVPSIGTWMVMGQQLRRWLTTAHRLRVFNGVMATLLLASLYPVLFP